MNYQSEKELCHHIIRLQKISGWFSFVDYNIFRNIIEYQNSIEQIII